MGSIVPYAHTGSAVRESLAKHATTYDHTKIPSDYRPEWQALLEAQVVADPFGHLKMDVRVHAKVPVTVTENINVKFPRHALQEIF